MDLSGHLILIVETGATPFAARLQSAIERAGAVTMVVRDGGAAMEQVKQVKQLKFSAAAVDSEHRVVAEELGIPYVLYVPTEPLRSIVSGLARLLIGP
jgi:hypothetical protein